MPRWCSSRSTVRSVDLGGWLAHAPSGTDGRVLVTRSERWLRLVSSPANMRMHPPKSPRTVSGSRTLADTAPSQVMRGRYAGMSSGRRPDWSLRRNSGFAWS
jgi:hypothetical protein